MKKFLTADKVSPKEAKALVRKWYPWWDESKISNFLILQTGWPLITNDQLNRTITLHITSTWDKYVELVKKKGYKVPPKPTEL